MPLRCNVLAVAAILACVQFANAEPVQLVDNLPGSFIDISQTGGTGLGLGDEDEIAVDTFPGNFVLAPGAIVVGNNGGIGFGNEKVTDLLPMNAPIPNSGAFLAGQALLALWDDIDDDIDDKNGDVYFGQVMTPSGAVRIVQWNDLPLKDNPQAMVTFQVQIFENPNPTGIYAQIVYLDVQQPGADGGASATIGYQDGEAGFGNFQWSFNAAGAVSDGTVLSLVIPEPHAIPTVSQWGLILLALLLLTAGTIAFRRAAPRRAAPCPNGATPSSPGFPRSGYPGLPGPERQQS